MKTYIENTSLSHPSRAVEHMFAVLGNKVNIDLKGWLPGNYRCEEAYNFPAPVPLKSIYPWSESERYQPFRKLAGCRDVGFRDCARYFINCINLTPDTVDGILDWKANIGVVEDVLINTPTITDEYEAKEVTSEFIRKCYGSKITDSHGGLTKEGQKSVRKVWFFDVQWSDCPEYIEDEARQIWTDRELGNDYYMYKSNLDDELFEDYPRVYLWLKHNGVAEGEEVVIHWWW